MGYVNSLEGMHVLISRAYLCYFVIFTQELVLRQHQSFVDASPEGKKVSARLVPGEDFVEMDRNIFIIYLNFHIVSMGFSCVQQRDRAFRDGEIFKRLQFSLIHR